MAEETTRNATYDKILEAAARVINNKGVFALTLEAVAIEAQVSKGGLLYHFAGKRQLMQAMKDAIMDKFILSVNKCVEADPIEGGKWSRAYLQTTMKQINTDFEMNAAFLSAVATSPELVKEMADEFNAMRDNINSDGLDSVKANIVRLAVDGLYYNQLYGIALSKDEQEKILQALLALTYEEIK